MSWTMRKPTAMRPCSESTSRGPFVRARVLQTVPEKITAMASPSEDMGDALRDLAHIVIGLDLRSGAVPESLPENGVLKPLLRIHPTIQDEGIGRDRLEVGGKNRHADRGEPGRDQDFGQIVHSHLLQGISAVEIPLVFGPWINRLLGRTAPWQ